MGTSKKRFSVTALTVLCISSGMPQAEPLVASPVTRWFEVAPENIDKHRLEFRLEVEELPDVYKIKIVILEKDDVLRALRHGLLQIRTPGLLIAWCDLEEKRIKNGIAYSFGVSKDYARYTVFSFKHALKESGSWDEFSFLLALHLDD